MSAGTADRVRAAYDAFAGFYDAFTHAHDYVSWTAQLERAALTAGLAGTRLLDLGCGTGKSFLPMLDRGYAVTGVDLSPRMLEVAATASGGRATLIEADLRELPDLGSFDLVWSLGEALNYLFSREELLAAVRGAARQLSPDGLLLFDLNTLATFRSVHAGLVVQAQEDRVLILDGRGADDPEPGSEALVLIEDLARGGDGAWRRVRTEHLHRHHPVELIGQVLGEAGLEALAVHGSRPDGRLDPVVDEEQHVKAVFIARHRRA